MKGFLVFLFVLLVISALVFNPIMKGLNTAAEGWKTDPISVIAKVIFSVIVGQLVFWVIGYDQWGIYMNPLRQLGFGQTVAVWVADRIHLTPASAWIIKVVEIMTDFGKVPIEGAVYIRYGYCPDGLATLITQPLWSTIETAEKLAGGVMRPEVVPTPEQVRLSLGCIYGSLFRYGQAVILWFFGPVIYGFIGMPIENGLRWIVGLVH